jgi:hypothetical protein
VPVEGASRSLSSKPSPEVYLTRIGEYLVPVKLRTLSLLPFVTFTIVSGGCVTPEPHSGDAVSRAYENLQGTVTTTYAGKEPDAPDPSQVTVSIEGDEGCGEISHSVSDDSAKSYTVIMHGVSLTRDTSGAEGYDLNCTLTVHYEYPAGWAFDTPSTIARGFVSTDQSSSMRLNLAAGISPAVVSTSQTFSASTSTDVKLAIDDPGMRDGSTCGDESADIQIRVDATALSEGAATLEIDSVDGRVSWRRCT